MTIPATTEHTTCTHSEQGDRLSRHVVSNGWLTYYRCAQCAGVSAVHTPRITWVG